jgi:tetratricopeptide (TPR) repeat protein
VENDEDAYDRADQLWRETLAQPEAQDLIRSALGELLSATDRPAVYWYWLGLACDRLDDGERAYECYQKALRMDDRLGPAYLGLAEHALKRYAWDEAIQRLQQARTAGERSARWDRLLGNAYDGLDDVDQALEHYQSAVGAGDRQAVLDLAKLLDRFGQAQAAAATYQLFLRAQPDNAEAWEALCRLLIRSRDLESARGAVRRMKGRLQDPGPGFRCQALVDFYNTGDAAGYCQKLQDWLADQPHDLQARLDLAEMLLAESEVQPANEQVQAVLTEEPEDIAARVLQASLLARLLQFDQAIDVMRGLLEQHPNRVNWLRQLANLHMDVQQYDEALAILDRLIEDGHGEKVSRDDLVTKYLALDGAKRSQQQVEHLKRWIEILPTDYVPRERLLDLLRDTGQPDEALRLARQWLDEEPSDRRRRTWLAQALTRAERYDAAIDALMSWLETEPSETERLAMLQQLGFTLGRGHRPELAVNFYRLWPANGWVRLFAADVAVTALLADRQIDRAIKLVDALPLRGEVPDIESGAQPEQLQQYWRIRLVRLLSWAGRHDDAVQEMESFLADCGADDAATWLYGMMVQSSVYRMAGRMEESAQVLEEAQQRFPRSEQVWNDLGYTWADMGKNVDQAEEMIRKAVGISPRNAAYLDSLGWVLYKQGRFAEAVAWLERAGRATGGDDPVLRDHLGDAYYRQGELQKAEEAWREGLRLHEQQQEDLEPAFSEPEAPARLQAKLDAISKGQPPPVAPLAREHEQTSLPKDLPGDETP